MFGLNKYTGLGEVFFDDATDDAVKLARKAVKAEMIDAAGMFSNITKSTLPQTNKYLQLINVSKTAEKSFKDCSLVLIRPPFLVARHYKLLCFLYCTTKYTKYQQFLENSLLFYLILCIILNDTRLRVIKQLTKEIFYAC